MEQIDAQAADLRYLAQAPASLTPAVSVGTYETPQPHGQQSSPGRSASIGDNSAPLDDGGETRPNPSKRKSFDDGGASGTNAKQTRSKRNRYISIACNECKRRKIKCNGETPCKRCGNLNLACLYAPNCCSGNFKDTDDYRQITSHIGNLQEEVHWLSQTVKALQAESTRLAPLQDSAIHGASPSVPLQPSSAKRPEPPNTSHGPYRGPTSMAYSLDIANNTISTMGYRVPGGSNEQQLPQTLDGKPTHSLEDMVTSDPLFEYDLDEMVRLCHLHNDEIGLMYPVHDPRAIISHAKTLATFFRPPKIQLPREVVDDELTLQLKMVICCALLLDEQGHSERAIRLFESMENVLNRKLMSDASNVASLPLFGLLAGYRFLSNDEILAWRVIGHVTRLCLELGIHRYSGLMQIGSERERRIALNNFWTAYVLDRRWAFGTGLPYVMQDSDIDPKLPIPEDHPFLASMVTYSRICAKVWQQVTNFEPVLAQELHQEELERLDHEILQWYEALPDEVKIRNWNGNGESRRMQSAPPSDIKRVRIWTYLRLNQIRTWLYTPVLHSATSIMTNPMQAQRAVDLARDTIQYLHNLNSTTNLYRRIEVFYHQFLASAISVLFLASVHAPVRFSAVCREEFYLALELVKDLSAKSWVSQRLWRTIRSLKDVAPRFGLDPGDDPHSTAALGMIGLARSHMESGAAPSGEPAQGAVPLDRNGAMIQNEMSRMFEGYVGLNGVQSVPSNGDGTRATSELQSPRSGAPVYGSGMDGADSVFPQFKELF